MTASKRRQPGADFAWFRSAGRDLWHPGPLGIWARGEWHSLEPLLGERAFDAIPLLADGSLSLAGLEALSQELGTATRLDGEPSFGLPLPQPRKILCIAKNYEAHAKELGSKAPKEPKCFAKLCEALAPDGAVVERPTGAGRVDYEGELCLVIAKRGKHLSEAAAASVIGGATLMNDVTAREMQKRDREQGYPWLRSKSFDGFAPCGPWVQPFASLFPGGEIPADATPDLALQTRVNGVLRQDSRTGLMLHSVARLISYLSQHTTLMPGDLIATGTPEGVGPLQSGDEVEVHIEGLGCLRHGVR
ncbi:MAG: hypothetical protein CSA62_14930 [Planctomycetota bacterium]|nr:MAG: hypothetical protein CSA62_14930 [Planctomycetota bacterium]